MIELLPREEPPERRKANRRAAPVVAQRFTDELCEMLIRRNYIQNVPLTGPQIAMVVEQALQLDASQRTEVEGQHGNK